MKISILIVDDEAAMEKLIRKIFRKARGEYDYSFSYFNTAEQAYQYIGISRDVDIVLLDIKMPGRINGLTLLEKIHKMNPLIKVIMISAYGDLKRSRIAIQHGAFDFLEKPIDPDDLKFVVRRAIDHILESKKVSTLISQLDTIGYFVKNDIIEFFKTKSISHAMQDCKKEVASVLVARIRDYTRQTMEVDPYHLVKQLNEYYTEITKAVDMYNGYIDKYLGDSVLAVFTGEDHMQNAVRAGIKIRRLIGDINRIRRINNEIPFTVGMGINTGEVVIGNIGSTDPIRLDHTVIGYPVNLCFYLQEMAAGGDILIPKNEYTNPLLNSYACNRLTLDPAHRLSEEGVEVYSIEK